MNFSIRLEDLKVVQKILKSSETLMQISIRYALLQDDFLWVTDGSVLVKIPVQCSGITGPQYLSLDNVKSLQKNPTTGVKKFRRVSGGEGDTCKLPEDVVFPEIWRLLPVKNPWIEMEEFQKELFWAIARKAVLPVVEFAEYQYGIAYAFHDCNGYSTYQRTLNGGALSAIGKTLLSPTAFFCKTLGLIEAMPFDRISVTDRHIHIIDSITGYEALAMGVRQKTVVRHPNFQWSHE